MFDILIIILIILFFKFIKNNKRNNKYIKDTKEIKEIKLDDFIDLKHIKGSMAERKVNEILESIPESKVLNDIMLKTESGTTQIDHLLIHKKGIFVIETKNFDGWIFGSERDKYWVQTIFNKKSKFYNPIRQNYGHIKAIEKYLPENRLDVLKSIILFNDQCEFKKMEVKIPVLKVSNLLKYINDLETEITLTNADIDYFYMILNKNNIIDEEERKNHINFVKEKKIAM